MPSASPVPRRFLTNTASLSASEVVSRVLTTVLLIYVARRLGVSAFGQLAFATALTSYLTLFSDLGLTSLGIREIARDPADSGNVVLPILVLQVAAAAIGLLVLALAIILSPLSGDTKLVTLILGLSAVPAALNLGYVFQGYERMEYVAISRVIGQLVYVATGLILLSVYPQVATVALAAVLGGLVTSWATFALLRRRFAFHLGRLDWTALRSLLGRALPFATSALMVQAYTNADSILLEFIKGNNAIGIYGAPYRLVLFILTAGGFVSRTLYPRLAALFQRDRASFDRTVNLMGRLLGAFGLPLTVVGVFYSRDIVVGLYGSAYADAAPILVILVFLVPVMFANSNIGFSLDASGHQRRSAVGTTIAAVGNVSINLLLIPRYGLVGAAAVSVGTEVFLLLWLAYYQKRDLGLNLLPTYFGKPLIASLLMAAAIFLSRTSLSTPWRLLLGVAVYAVAMVALRAIRKDEVLSIRNSWGRGAA